MVGTPLTWNNFAGVAQTATKSLALPGNGFLWVNDTAKAANIREEFSVTPRVWDQPVDGVSAKVAMVQSTIVFERQLSTDAVPFRLKVQMSIAKSALGVPVTARYNVKDFNSLWTALTNLDVEIDDFLAGRAQLA